MKFKTHKKIWKIDCSHVCYTPRENVLAFFLAFFCRNSFVSFFYRKILLTFLSTNIEKKLLVEWVLRTINDYRKKSQFINVSNALSSFPTIYHCTACVYAKRNLLLYLCKEKEMCYPTFLYSQTHMSAPIELVRHILLFRW